MADPPSGLPSRPKIARLARSDRARGRVYGLADRLPPRARSALLRAARAVRDTLTAPKEPSSRAGTTASRKAPPRSFRISPAPPPVTGEWPEPPEVGEPGRPVRSVYRKGGTAPRFDIELFEALNAEYAPKQVVPAPQILDTPSRAERARRRLAAVHDSIGLAGHRVLEFGCGAGFEVWFLAHHFGADAYGVDVSERAAWALLNDDRTHLVCADITESNPFEADFFDRIISFSVFEHVQHPFRALQEIHRIMKPGGLAWISANLYRSAVASHLYRDIHFPFPHLLFSDDVIKEFYRRRGDTPRGASWVNKLTWLQYERYLEMVGFRTKMLRFSERDLDETFYARFEDVLGRYPRWDLTKDFFTVVLEKPA